MKMTVISMRIGSLALVLLLLLSLGGSQELAAGSNKPPVASFIFSPSTPDVNTPVVFNAGASKDPDGRILKYEWDLNGDKVFEEVSSSPIIKKLFDSSGTFKITLRVTDNGGLTASITKTITIKDAIVLIRRAIVPAKVKRGTSFKVTVKLKANKLLKGLGLDEDIPKGWQSRVIDSGGAMVKKSELQWLWAQELKPGDLKNVSYEVTLPRSAKTGRVALDGVVSSFSPKFKLKVVGDSEVQVN